MGKGANGFVSNRREDKPGGSPSDAGRYRPGSAQSTAGDDKDERGDQPPPSTPGGPDGPREDPPPSKKVRVTPPLAPKFLKAVEIPAMDLLSSKRSKDKRKATRSAAVDESFAAKEKKSYEPDPPPPPPPPPPHSSPRSKPKQTFPSTWAERFSTPFLSAEAFGANLDAAILANLSGPIAAIAERVEGMWDFVTLSVARGNSNETVLVHNINVYLK